MEAGACVMDEEGYERGDCSELGPKPAVKNGIVVQVPRDEREAILKKGKAAARHEHEEHDVSDHHPHDAPVTMTLPK